MPLVKNVVFTVLFPSVHHIRVNTIAVMCGSGSSSNLVKKYSNVQSLSMTDSSELHII